MKKIFLSVVAVFLGFIAVGQDTVDLDWKDTKKKLKYTQIGSTNNVRVQQLGGGQEGMPTGELEIPLKISREDIVYTVTEIASDGFSGLNDLSKVTIPDSVTKIGNNAFMYSGGNAHPFIIIMSKNIKEIGASAFKGCNNLLSIVLPEGLEKIGSSAFASCNGITEIILPSTLETLGSRVFDASNNLSTIKFNSWPLIEADAFQGCPNNLVIKGPCGLSLSGLPNSIMNNYTSNCMLTTKKNGDFDNGDTWGVDNMSVFDENDRMIQSIHKVTIPNGVSLDISGSNPKLTNNGTLVLEQGGQLVGVPEGSGTIEVETPNFEDRAWYFVGAPFANYGFDVIKFDSTTDDAVVSLFNHSTAQWRVDYTEIYEETVAAGEGFLVWPFTAAKANEPVVFTNKGNYSLNYSDVTVTKTLHEDYHWMALANPYTFKLNIATFLDDQPKNTIQGGVSYRFNGIYWTIANEGEINVTEGFFVNFTSGGEKTANFKKTQRYVPSAKANTEREFIRLSMVDGESNIELLFAHNEDAEQGYDIYDANKMFATTGVSEPYFVTEGIALVKEEVKELPYYATMNVRSSESKEVKFKVDYIPEGLAVSIIDGEEVIDLTEGVEYATEIASGENADRFKVLVKKNVGLADVEELDVRIVNSNRHIAITAQENVKVTVYNTLGQKVFETEETNFVLSGVASGAYVVKVQGAKASKSQKIVVE